MVILSSLEEFVENLITLTNVAISLTAYASKNEYILIKMSSSISYRAFGKSVFIINILQNIPTLLTAILGSSFLLCESFKK